MDAPADLLNPTPEEMSAARLEAARAERWSHWEHEIDQHADDWYERGQMPKPMTAAQFRALPEVVARYQFVELCVYRYRRRIVWGFYCRKLLFQENWLSQVVGVLDPQEKEIVHCMYSDKGKKYCKGGWVAGAHAILGGAIQRLSRRASRQNRGDEGAAARGSAGARPVAR